MLALKVETYEDKDGAREDEIAALGGQTATGTNVYSAFYDRLKEVCFLPFCIFLVFLGSFFKDRAANFTTLFFSFVDGRFN